VRVLKKLSDLLIFSNLFVALAVACLTFETQLLQFGNTDLHFTSFVFFSTLFLYNFHRAYRLRSRSNAEQEEKRHLWVRNNRIVLYSILAIAAAGLAFVTLRYIRWDVILCLVPVALISFGYSVPFIPTVNGFIRLRDIPMLKIFLIVIVLCLVTVVLPTLSFSSLPEYPVNPWILRFVLLRRMLFIFAITIPFDIRDIEHDRSSGLRTIPGIFGERNARLLAELALMLFAGLVIVQWKNDLLPLPYVYALIASALFAAVMVWLSTKERKEYFYTFLVEGSMIVQALLVLLAYRYS
jgi:4-hydroxybenzoate polyprenyltransferase